MGALFAAPYIYQGNELPEFENARRGDGGSAFKGLVVEGAGSYPAVAGNRPTHLGGGYTDSYYQNW